MAKFAWIAIVKLEIFRQICMTKIEAKDTIEKLAERFDYHIDGYKKGNFNETQTRTDYINPLFEALGWDINNKAGLAESYREVIHEDKIKISGSTKAPDYCFTVYGQKKFFLEAKKPSVLVKEAIDPAYQIRRYGWSAKMPISIISDFEEFAIYDCTIKPSPTDKASVSRIKYITFKDYIKEFDFLWDTFSKEMVLKGSFDKFVSSNKGKKGTSGVDAEFLKSLDSWRDLLARNIVNRNPGITEDELNYSLQKVIDRIIFLRICEDRGVELENQLYKSIGTNTYQNLKVLFHSADLKYNSGLFDYKKDNITDNLNIDDKILKTIIEEMYYPKSPYEFSVLPVEILGHSYEQYLGKVIKITPGHRIKIEEKPEVRKAGGVYYTPQYIVDYIVKNTVGKLIAGKSPEDVAKIKICDPACGSGSFLLGAYQYLLDWHMQYYMNEPATGRFSGGQHPNLTPDGNLTTAIKKKILINNIYGLDIDTNAVEVTKLSLMLKAMEGETEASISQLSFLHERVLPTLDNNIKSGNSLIDIDFYDSQIDFEPGAEKKIKPFNWQNAFPEVFKDKIVDENLQAYHITWATYNSRVSERMIAYENVIKYRRAKKNEPEIKEPRLLDLEEELFLSNCIKEISKQYNYRIIGFNICRDHVHIAVVCQEDDIPAIVRTIKSISSRKLNEHNGMTQTKEMNINKNIGASSNASNERQDEEAFGLAQMKEEAFGLAQMSNEQERGFTQTHLWQSKYSASIIQSDEEMYNVLSYIKNNRIKHELPENEKLISIINSFTLNPADAFKPTHIKGGFDVVIGNPPYVKEYTDRESFENIKKSHLIKYYQGKMDLWYFFVCYGLDLLRKDGMLGFIVPNNWVTNSGASILRNKIVSDSQIHKMIDFQNFMVFQDASIQTMVLILEKNNNIDNYQLTNIKVNDKSINTLEIQDLLNSQESSKASILNPIMERENFIDKFILFESSDKNIILNKMNNSNHIKFMENEVAQGIVAPQDFLNKSNAEKLLNKYVVGTGIFVINNDEKNNLLLNANEKDLIKPYYTSVELKKYYGNPNNTFWVIYTNSSFKNLNVAIQYPNIKLHLDKFKNIITSHNKPYGLHRARDINFFEGEKILSLRKCIKPTFTYTNFPCYVSQSYFVIKTNRLDNKCLVGLLNSKLIEFWLKYKGKMQGTNYQIDKEPLLQIPIYNSSAKPKIQDQIIKLVETMLQLNKDLQNASLPEQKEQLQARIIHTDRTIDQLVYQLYELSEEEIKIVEGE